MNQQNTKVFIEGRYRKLTRDLPQTLFYCPECKGHPRRRKGCETCEGFGKLTRDSVQELVAWVVAKAFGTRKQKFHGAGREDMDVRMLGAGRPFVLELINAKNFGLDLAELEAEVNSRNAGRLEVLNLHYSEKPRIVVLKEGKHAKEYRALIEVDGDTEAAAAGLRAKLGERLVVVQQTPLRVAHRRADLERERWIELTNVETPGSVPSEVPGDPDVEIPAGHLRVTLLTEHGTYVKEAISGEEGRTNPNLTDFAGCACKCIELDVLAMLDEDGQPEPEQPIFQAPFGSGL